MRVLGGLIASRLWGTKHEGVSSPLKTPIEETKRKDGGVIYGDPSARSTRFRSPHKLFSNDIRERLKSTGQADGMINNNLTESISHEPLWMICVTEFRIYEPGYHGIKPISKEFTVS